MEIKPKNVSKIAILIFLLAVGMNFIPSDTFANSQFVQTLIEFMTNIGTFSSAKVRLDTNYPEFSNKFLFTYAAVSFFCIMLTAIVSAFAFFGSKNGRPIVPTPENQSAILVAAISAIALFAFQLFWIDKFPSGRTGTAIPILSLGWIGFYYCCVFYFSHLGRKH